MTSRRTSPHPGTERLVHSRRNRHVQDFRRLDRTPALRRRRRVLLGEGIKVLETAAAAGARFEVILHSARVESDPRGRRLLARLRAAGEPLVPLAAPVMDYIHGGSGHQGILAVVRRPETGLEPLLAAGPAPFLLFGIGFQDPGNIGSMVRAADAAGATAVLVSRGSVDPFGRRAVRASMGSVFRVRVVPDCEPERVLERLDGAGIRCLAAEPDAPESLWDVDLSGGIAILLGAEGRGLPPELRHRIAGRFRIPMRAGVDSLNVAAAAALIGYEAARRRSGPP